MPRSKLKKASPTDLIWAGSVQWGSGSGSPTYAYAFGPDEATVDTVLQHLQDAVVNMEFQKNHAPWVPRLGQSKPTSRAAAEEEIFEGIEESTQICGPSRHQLDEMWFEDAHMPEVLARIKTEPLVIDLPILAFDDLAPYCKQPEALRPFIIGGETSSIPNSPVMANRVSTDKERKMHKKRIEGSSEYLNEIHKINRLTADALGELDELKRRLGLPEHEFENLQRLIDEIWTVSDIGY